MRPGLGAGRWRCSKAILIRTVDLPVSSVEQSAMMQLSFQTDHVGCCIEKKH